MKSYKLHSLVIFIIMSFLFSGCELSRRVNSANSENLPDQAGPVAPEFKISQDRKNLDEMRKDIPVEKRQTNDELGVVLATIGNGEKNSYKAREDWQNILRKKRDKFDNSIQKQREDFSRSEKSARDVFEKKLDKDRQEFQKKKADQQERSDFYQQSESQRREYFSDEQIRRSNFEAEVRDKRAEFEDYIHEKNNLFNDELRAVEKREEARKKEEHNINPAE